jgi:NADH-quinone oxidoreductase subunit J
MMTALAHPVQWILGSLLILSSLGVILVRKPVHASLCFLLTLLMLAALYLQLSASFIAVMQVLVYAGAILVIFMFVIILFQDAHQQIDRFPVKSSWLLLFAAASTFLLSLGIFGERLLGFTSSTEELPEGFGTVQSIGEALYVDFFFPFEAVILLFLIAVVGALYIGKKRE